MQLNLITACGGPYSMEYAEKTHNMISRHLDLPFNSYCITERPHELPAQIQPIEPELIVKGWWNKTLAFSKNMPDGYILILDVDLIVLNNITAEVNFALQNLTTIAAYSDAVNWHGSKLSSSFMIFKSGSLSQIFENFKSQYKQLENFQGGDQVWMYPQIQDVLYIDEYFPNFKRSLKFNIGQVESGSIHLPSKLNPDIKILDCHGRPKPHELTSWPVISEHWR